MYVLSRPVLLGLQLLGLLPVSVDHLPLRGDVARLSWPRVAYSLLLVLSYCVIFFFWIWQLTEETSDLASHATFRITSFCRSFSTYLGAVVATINAVSSVKQKILLVDRLCEIDFLLQRKASPPHLRRMSLLVMGGFLTLSALEMAELLMNEREIYENCTSSVFQLFKINILFSLVEVMEVVLAVRERFQLVNERVLELVARSRSKQLMWTVALPCVETFTMPQESKMTIPGLSEIHWSLCCVVHDINSIYGCSLVTAMIFIFAHLVFYPYFLFVLFENYSKNLIHMAVSFMWILVMVIKLYVLVLPCSLTVKEAKKTVMIVTKLMGNKMTKPLFYELERFADQLFHRDVEFTACGLFTLHTSIIIPVASAVTTYMAIIIQFQASADDEEDANSEAFPGVAVNTVTVVNSSLHTSL